MNTLKLIYGYFFLCDKEQKLSTLLQLVNIKTKPTYETCDLKLYSWIVVSLLHKNNRKDRIFKQLQRLITR
jgi:hypothetical protein